jgi:hypothetical protein
MPRDSGTFLYSAPANTNGIQGQPILPAPYNNWVSDITATLNQAWPQSLGGTGFASWSLAKADVLASVSFSSCLLRASNLSDLLSVSTARSNLGLSNLATTTGGATGLSIVAASTQAEARTAMALGTASVLNTGAAIGNVVQYAGAANKLPVADGSALTGIKGNFVEFNAGPFAVSTAKVVPHGLPAVPSRVDWYLKCNLADNEYAAGDYAIIANVSVNSSVWFNATSVGLSPRLGSSLSVVQKNTLGDGSFTNSRWDVVFRVFP